MSELPQLRMRRSLDQELPTMSQGPNQGPFAYQLRPASTSDAKEIARVLEISFEETWTEQRVLDALLLHPNVPKTFVVTSAGQVVATASYQVMPEEFPEAGWVHYVGVDSAHRGRKLGFRIVLAVMQEAIQNDRNVMFLTTDDFRVPAIKTYLSMGFEPDHWHESHPLRWAQVFRQIQGYLG